MLIMSYIKNMFSDTKNRKRENKSVLRKFETEITIIFVYF
jgi:hypothetical protein